MRSALFLLLLAAPQTIAGAESPLVGRWDAVQRSRGGLGVWLEFKADGTCTSTNGAMLDGAWDLQADRLTITLSDPAAGAPAVHQVLTVAVADDVMTQTVSGGRRQLMHVGPIESAEAPVAGFWSAPHPAGGTAYEEFNPDGRYLFRLPMATTSCRWELHGETVTVASGSTTVDYHWTLDGNALTLEGGGRTRGLHRERAGVIPAASRPGSR